MRIVISEKWLSGAAAINDAALLWGNVSGRRRKGSERSVTAHELSLWMFGLQLISSPDSVTYEMQHVHGPLHPHTCHISACFSLCVLLLAKRISTHSTLGASVPFFNADVSLTSQWCYKHSLTKKWKNPSNSSGYLCHGSNLQFSHLKAICLHPHHWGFLVCVCVCVWERECVCCMQDFILICGI